MSAIQPSGAADQGGAAGAPSFRDDLADAIDRLFTGQPIACALCHNYSCVCPPFGHPAYFVLIDYRHGKITADDPEFRRYFRIAQKG